MTAVVTLNSIGLVETVRGRVCRIAVAARYRKGHLIRSVDERTSKNLDVVVRVHHEASPFAVIGGIKAGLIQLARIALVRTLKSIV